MCYIIIKIYFPSSSLIPFIPLLSVPGNLGVFMDKHIGTKTELEAPLRPVVSIMYVPSPNTTQDRTLSMFCIRINELI